MNQKTYLQPNYEDPEGGFDYVTVIDTACPVCRAHIRFIPPDGKMISYRQEADFFKKECQRLRFELFKAEQFIREKYNLLGPTP